jgi:hypothetical protein
VQNLAEEKCDSLRVKLAAFQPRSRPVLRQKVAVMRMMRRDETPIS